MCIHSTIRQSGSQKKRIATTTKSSSMLRISASQKTRGKKRRETLTSTRRFVAAHCYNADKLCKRRVFSNNISVSVALPLNEAEDTQMQEV